MKKSLSLVVFLVVFVSAEAKDITQLVIDNTDIKEKVASACQSLCGNRGWSKFESLEISHKSGNLYRVVAKGSAKFHNVMEFAGGFEIQYPIQVTINGTLDSSSCILTVDTIQITGDILGITNGAKAAEGKKRRIKDCKKYT